MKKKRFSKKRFNRKCNWPPIVKAIKSITESENVKRIVIVSVEQSKETNQWVPPVGVNLKKTKEFKNLKRLCSKAKNDKFFNQKK